MDTNEKKQIESFLEELAKLNVAQIITGYFKEQEKKKEKNYEMTNYGLNGFINTTVKVIANFRRELESLSWPTLQMVYIRDEQGRRNLLGDFETLLKSLNSKRLDNNYLFALESLVYYQRSNNFWYSNDAQVKIEKLLEAESEVTAKKALFDSTLKNADELAERAKQQVEEMNKIAQDLKRELEKSIIGNENSLRDNKKIQELINEINTSRGRVDEITKSLTERADSFKNRVETEQEKFEQYKKSQNELETKVKEKIEAVAKAQKAWDDKLESIKDIETFMKEKEKQINELTGFSAGASLFHTFQERKKELQNPVQVWGWGVILMTLILVTTLILVFYYTPATTEKGTSWGIFALNTLKSLPAVILLYFAIRQYNKERAFQEEYAFKSSVALTVKAFADVLTDGAKSNKDILIMNSVNKIYETPTTMKEKGGLFTGLKSKNLNETLKNLTEAIKEIKK